MDTGYEDDIAPKGPNKLAQGIALGPARQTDLEP
jgi:hypothetical protein